MEDVRRDAMESGAVAWADAALDAHETTCTVHCRGVAGQPLPMSQSWRASQLFTGVYRILGPRPPNCVNWCKVSQNGRKFPCLRVSPTVLSMCRRIQMRLCRPLSGLAICPSLMGLLTLYLWVT